MNKRITSASPSITQHEIDLVNEAIKFGWGDKMNFYIEQFVNEFSNYIGIEYTLPVAHCTDAIHLAMLALGIGPNDEVIVPDLTWVASASPILYVGATPVFADVDPVSFCITAESIEKNITTRTKAVVVVDLLGNMPDWDEIIDLCNKRNILIIEDAAESIGASYKGRNAGTFGHVSLFSFNATKLIQSGQGGAFCTNHKSYFDKAKLHSHHGIDKSQNGKYYWSSILGYNYNWTNIQAALALAQLRRIEDLIKYKLWLFEKYKSGLEGIDGITLSDVKKDVFNTRWINTVIIDPKYNLVKEDMIELFSTYNIDMRPLFYPISDMPPFSNFIKSSNNTPISHQISKYGICLPNGNNLTEIDVMKICNTFKEILK
jgi:perosamine synthetase